MLISMGKPSTQYLKAIHTIINKVKMIMLVVSKNNIHVRKFHEHSLIDQYYINLLIQEVYAVYNIDPEKWNKMGVLSQDKEELIVRIEEGMEGYNPRLIYAKFDVSKNSDLPFYLSLKKDEDDGYCRCIVIPDRNGRIISVICCGPYLPIDALLFKALSNIIIDKIIMRNLENKMIYQSFINNIIKKQYRRLCNYKDLINCNINFWEQEEEIERFIRVDLSDNTPRIPADILWKGLDDLDNMGLISHLIKKFLSLDIYDISDNQIIPIKNFPVIGELSYAILHVYYQTVFDVHLKRHYPGLRYTRCGTELLLASTSNDDFDVDKEDITDIVKKLNLRADIDVIHPNECMGGVMGNRFTVFIDTCGSISFVPFEERNSLT